ncbi:hypothetical protein GH714_007920 [Hevea brasiliensis]|uniref:Integrase catalytic domain-containing protein n=1 Tax=Hevea brasiliensis TaxID=3981 RepID=A0A6A6N7K1_HEVBR|nr:hypothetical protein GH714_007920 [Hevea brasiliensis]
MRECHDVKWAGHPGAQRMQALLERGYYWPRMLDDIQLYVKTCLVCQQDKGDQRRPAGLLEPLPTPSRPWESISMDFIVGLLKVNRLGNIMVVVDKLNKYAIFIPASVQFDVREAARLFFKGVVKYWGLLRTIISDRDARFTGMFWTELFRLRGTELNFSTSFHPQIDDKRRGLMHYWSYICGTILTVTREETTASLGSFTVSI